MLRSMYAGVSGLNSHQQMMDVTGNNISNVNTIGFKSSRVTFKEMLSQTIQGASAPQDNRAGTNPQQVGLGVGLGSIDNDMSSGNLQSTGKTSDVAIQGDGFFVLRDGNTHSYSRAGNFNFDENGNLYSSSTGLLVQGWMADADGEYGDLNAQNIEDISLRQEINAVATDRVRYGKNLDADAVNNLEISEQTLGDDLSFSINRKAGSDFNVWEFTFTDEAGAELESGEITLNADGTIASIVDSADDDLEGSITVAGRDFTVLGEGDLISGDDPLLVDNADADNYVTNDYSQDAKRNIAVDVFNSQGGKHTVNLPLVKTANNEWTVIADEIAVDGIEGSHTLEGGDHAISFDANGNIDSGQLANLSFTPSGPAEEQSIELDFNNFTQFAGSMTANFTNVNGYTDGALESFSFTETGDVVGSYSNGLTQTLAKIGLANFSNPAGLTRNEGVFQVSANSGDPELGSSAQGGFGTLAPATLEMSNANLSQEFTNMITAQRGFQASSKLITTSDEMLQELVNLKR